MKKNIFISRIKEKSLTNGDKNALIFLSQKKIVDTYTYKMLDEKIDYYTNYFLGLNLAKRVCIMYLTAGCDSIAIIFGAISAGITPIIRTIGQSITMDKLSYQLEEIINEIPEVTVLITNFDYEGLEEKAKLGKLHYVYTERKNNNSVENYSGKSIDADLILLTSGSTKFSKGVKIDIDKLLMNVLYCDTLWNVDEKSKCLTWMPHSHIYGLVSGILLPLYKGSTTYIMSPKEFSSNMENWLESLSIYKITHTHTAASNFTLENSLSIVRKNKIKNLNLSNLKTLSLGGEAVNIAILKKFNDCFSKFELNENIYSPNYGMTEISGLLCGTKNSEHIYSVKVDEDKFKIESKLDFDNIIKVYEIISVGTIDKKNVKILSPETNNILEDKTIGEICIIIPSMTTGYLKDEDNDCFTQYNGKRMYRTGDLGFVENSHLFVTGKIKELIKINGKNISPFSIEQCINLKLKNDDLGNVVAFSLNDENGIEEVGIMIETHKQINNQKHIKNQIVQLIQKNLQVKILFNNILLIYKNNIPRFSNGKISRKKCGEYFFDIRDDEYGKN